MKWSWKIGEYRGIGVYVHATFMLVIVWVALIYWSQSKSVAETIAGITFIIALFGCVLLHEFGHALMAQRYNIKTRDITLLPIGGVARLEKMPDDPKQELWVALAGPAVNVLIAVILFMWLSLTNTLELPLLNQQLRSGSFIQNLMIVNVFLVIFNLLPAFPMDGGRVLRALLALRLNYARATQIAATFGQAIAFMFAFIGFSFGNPFLIFIALFVWIGAAQEASLTQMKSAFHGIPVDEAMITDFNVLNSNDTLAEAVKQILSGSQQDFPVIENHHVVGILTRDMLMKSLAKYGQSFPIARAMKTDFETAHAGEMLQTAFIRLQGCACRILPVLKEGKLIGLLTMENVGEFMMIQAALSRSGRKPPSESSFI